MSPTGSRCALLLLLALAGCGPTQAQNEGRCAIDADCPEDQSCNVRGFCQARLGCRADSDCAENQACEVASGLCLCVNDQACAAGEFCNPSKRCQPYGSCSYNGDCPAGLFCDVPNSKCIANGSCSADTQCALGQLCDPAQSACVPGCRSSGDCPQTTVDSSGVTVFSPQGCVSGQCQAGKCSSSSGCTFGQRCTNESCVSACSATTPYCRACTQSSQCGGAKNFCLVDSRNSSACSGNNPPPSCKYFCGIDCSAGQACPSGFTCNSIVVVVPKLECNCNTTCSNGTGPCRCNEGAVTGFCACRQGNDCGPGLQCENGSCLIGKNCFPAKGLYCDAPGPACN